jgi:hypothetical protein
VPSYVAEHGLMGLFDEVYVSSDAVAAWRLSCPACGVPPDTTLQWQTKSFSPCMCSYLIRHDAHGAVRLYSLDRPSDRRFWREWTEDEIAESEREAKEGNRWAMLLRKEAGAGTWLPEAFLPENRRQRFMGELPHQWVEIYAQCECGEHFEYWIKFSDGVATEARREAPKLDFIPDGGLGD